MEYNLRRRFYSSEDDCYYRVVMGRPNSCRGCCFADWEDNGDCDCCKPDDAGDCTAEYRSDGNDVIFKEA